MMSFISVDLINENGAKYGIAYLFFPETPGFETGNPDDFSNPSDDIWNQTMTRKFDSYKAAKKFSEEFQSEM